MILRGKFSPRRKALLALVLIVLAWLGYAWYANIAITRGIEQKDMDWNGDGTVSRDEIIESFYAVAVNDSQDGNRHCRTFVWRSTGEQIRVDCRTEFTPAAADENMYLDDAGELIPMASIIGPLASGVPGSPQGLYDLHLRFGSLPWATVVEPARRLAALGFRVDRHLSRAIRSKKEIFEMFPETAALWLPGGEAPAVGSRLRLPELARTLRDYAEKGPRAITHGPVAAAVEAASHRHGGVLTAADLAAYTATWREPLRFEAFGWQVASMPLPASGGIILAQSTALLERLGWQDQPRFGARRRHMLVEVLRTAFADRYLMGDPRTSAVQPASLLSDAALKTRLGKIRLDRATPSLEIHPGATATTEPSDTTHLSVVDGQGNLVALTTTLNGLFGCGLYVPGAGFFLNNEMDDFASSPGRPNMFGLVQGEANKVRPGHRMLSSMSPTIAWRTGKAGTEAIALGGRGGSRIPTNTLQVLLNMIVDGDPLQTALDRPRLHHQWLPDRVEAEPDTLSPETRSALEGLGHTFLITTRTAKMEAVRSLPGGRVEAANDPRVQASAGVVHLEP